MIRAVLFDLDDTLFDHRHAARQAIGAVRAGEPMFAAVAADDLEREHSTILEAIHPRVLTGEITLDQARHERFSQLFEWAGAERDDAAVERAIAAYRQHYVGAWREVAGASALLRALCGRARTAIVSNNLAREQHDKLRACGLDVLFDVVVISEEAGVAKPDPAIFAIVLDRLGVSAEEALMIGDAWQTDIAGARAAGLRALWFNPLGVACPEPVAGIEELRSLEPADAVLSTIFRAEMMGAGRA